MCLVFGFNPRHFDTLDDSLPPQFGVYELSC